jgi:integration host factor subunit alpha
MTLNKLDIALQICSQHEGITNSRAIELVEAFLRISKNCLIGGSDLKLRGLGKFSVKDKRSRKGHNFQTGEELILDARRVVTFKPSRILRDKVNGSE